jgi:hypothetical protein
MVSLMSLRCRVQFTSLSFWDNFLHSWDEEWLELALMPTRWLLWNFTCYTNLHKNNTFAVYERLFTASVCEKVAAQVLSTQSTTCDSISYSTNTPIPITCLHVGDPSSKTESNLFFFMPRELLSTAAHAKLMSKSSSLFLPLRWIIPQLTGYSQTAHLYGPRHFEVKVVVTCSFLSHQVDWLRDFPAYYPILTKPVLESNHGLRSVTPCFEL